MPKGKISVQSAKAKGRRLQQLVRDKLRSLSSNFREGDIESRGMGQSGEDIILSPHARDLLPLSIECKSYAKFAVYSIIDQCKANCPSDCEPVVVLKADHKKPVAVIDLDYYIKLESYRIKGK
jgi:hypothetical protein